VPSVLCVANRSTRSPAVKSLLPVAT
jgi:hypothetical protein